MTGLLYFHRLHLHIRLLSGTETLHSCLNLSQAQPSAPHTCLHLSLQTCYLCLTLPQAQAISSLTLNQAWTLEQSKSLHTCLNLSLDQTRTLHIYHLWLSLSLSGLMWTTMIYYLFRNDIDFLNLIL